MCRDATASAIGPSAPACLSAGEASKWAGIQRSSLLANETVSRGFVLSAVPSITTVSGAVREHFGCPAGLRVKPSRPLVVISIRLSLRNVASTDASVPGVSASILAQYAASYLYARVEKRTRSG